MLLNAGVSAVNTVAASLDGASLVCLQDVVNASDSGCRDGANAVVQQLDGDGAMTVCSSCFWWCTNVFSEHDWISGKQF